MSDFPTREEAYALLTEYNQSESLIKHALSVEAVMRHFAPRFRGDAEVWGVVGLVHDLDYEKWPEEHCKKTEEILKERGWPEELVRAVVSHGWGIVTEVEPKSDMEKVLFATDELTGLVTATALVRPSKSILDMSAKSVKKKWNQKAFAAGANREIIAQGAEMLGMELSELISETITGMRPVAEQIGLAGSAAES
ncbi:hydrolase [Marispirochaeta aestuarii]|uniref:Hydrolase n=1 Tax=Marispirochaeta aestuarii TaxID=1963862 RepID=A0A1Y1RZT3_9SPIO|nr:HDIG domain-containing metalloprotein [Marispirochaeta aestuarii]ORC36352.1 hydrolase [Marispirochaeta aestuarii]